ncbi:unnamed protein product [Cochlearia groenlandica]
MLRLRGVLVWLLWCMPELVVVTDELGMSMLRIVKCKLRLRVIIDELVEAPSVIEMSGLMEVTSDRGLG